MYKALVTDLDGTAVNISSDGSDIDQSTKDAIQAALKEGKKLTCASGREWEVARSVIQALGFTAPCIVEGGTRIIDPKTETTIWEKSLDKGVPQKVLAIFKSASTAGFVSHSPDIIRRKLTDVDELPDTLRFLYLIAVDEKEAINIVNQINTQLHAVAHFTPSWNGAGLVDIHVVHPEATKEHAIQVWQKREGVTMAETIGMGDSGNDVPIFQSSGYKIAVGNATPNLKELADYIAPPVTERPLLHVIETILLN